ncbi:MAG TPA: tetratricopeptide repeat protein [Thermoanaerobaculia bacterium]|nr:tetratricopeptide repeat protein [Thermoanaerobaculia bacterium]
MKRISLLLLAFVISGCTMLQGPVTRMTSGSNPYRDDPFYVRYLRTDNQLDHSIHNTLAALRVNPWYAPLHNQLGELLTRKGFPKDAELEFRRAVASDSRFYPAWYNLGLIRESQGQDASAMRAYRRTIDLKSGHAAAHFQLGLIYEKLGRPEAATDHYAKAFRINEALLDVRVNPRILDTELIDRALLTNYPVEHARESIQFEPTPAAYPGMAAPLPVPRPQPAASPQEAPEDIVTPAPPVTDPSQRAPAPDSEPEIEPDEPPTAIELQSTVSESGETESIAPAASPSDRSAQRSRRTTDRRKSKERQEAEEEARTPPPDDRR